MAMNESVLAQNIKKIILEIREEETNPDESMETFCRELAKVIIAEVRKMTITATCTHGPVKVSNIE